MSSIQHFVSPKVPTILANQAHVDLPGYDLFLHYEHAVLVIPAELDVPRFEEALSRALQQCPHAAGQLRCLDGRWFVELTNTAIPVDIDYKLNTSPDSFLDGDWVVQDDISPLLSHQPVNVNVVNSSTPLLRFKLTFFDHETCVGASWHHSLGDGTIMEFADPTFQKYHFPTPSRSVVAEFLPRMPYNHATHQMSGSEYAEYLGSHGNFGHLRWRIDGHDLLELRSVVSSKRQDGRSPSKQDCLIAYLVTILNYNRSTPLQKVTNMITCRGVPTPFFDQRAASCFLVDVTANIPRDMAGIATALRDAFKQCREPDYIYGWFTLESHLMLEAANAGNVFPYFSDDDGLIVISFIPMDWCSIHFGYPDGTRFHQAGVDKHVVKIFRSNPVKGDDGIWQTRQSVDISIGVAAELEPKLLETLSRGVRYMLNKESARL